MIPGMNWGKGIAIFYTLFAATMIFAVIRSTQYDNSLVSEKYYQDDIAYQQQYDRIKNSQELLHPLEVQYEKESEKLILLFPPHISTVEGSIHLFCPSASHEDVKYPIALEEDSNRQTLLLSSLRKGLWKVKIHWEGAGQEYYDEKTIVR
jgi:hypothetical protein